MWHFADIGAEVIGVAFWTPKQTCIGIKAFSRAVRTAHCVIGNDFCESLPRVSGKGRRKRQKRETKTHAESMPQSFVTGQT